VKVDEAVGVMDGVGSGIRVMAGVLRVRLGAEDTTGIDV
jgi:hypothetical protein